MNGYERFFPFIVFFCGQKPFFYWLKRAFYAAKGTLLVLLRAFLLHLGCIFAQNP